MLFAALTTGDGIAAVAAAATAITGIVKLTPSGWRRGSNYVDVVRKLDVLENAHNNLSGKVDEMKDDLKEQNKDLKQEILANRKLILRNGGS